MNDRKSYPAPFGAKYWSDTTETYMLHDDFHNHIVPHRSRGNTYRLLSDYVPLQSLIDAFTPENRRRNLDGWIQRIATRLLMDHEVWLEIVFEGPKGETPFAVFPVNGQIDRLRGTTVQKLPKRDDLPDWYPVTADWPQEVELDSERMVHVVLPDEYPSHVLTEVVMGLAEIGGALVPSWYLGGLSGVRNDVPLVNTNEVMRTRQLRVAQVALPIGWTGREVYGSNRPLNEYFRLWRELWFLHFRSAMRSCAEQALEQVLGIVANNIGIVASVVAFGTHTPNDVEQLIQKFEEGNLSFSQARDMIYERTGDDDSAPRRVV